jgi:hypothetical protein
VWLHHKIGKKEKEKEKEALPTIIVNWLVGLGILEQQHQPKIAQVGLSIEVQCIVMGRLCFMFYYD